jgi:hypothetical protein
MPTLNHLKLASAPILCVLFLSACGSKTIDQSSAASIARKGLAATNAGPAKSVSCPSSTPAKVGTTLECHIVLTNGGSVTFTERVASVSGSSAHLTIVGAKQS